MDGALDERHGHPAPHTCFPARSVLPLLALAGSCMAHLRQEASRAHLAENPSSPRLLSDILTPNPLEPWRPTMLKSLEVT